MPSKIGDAAAVQEMGDELILVTDNMAAAAETAIRAAALGRKFPMMIEIDTGDGRCGLDPESEAGRIVELGRVIHQSAALELRGVLTHAGQSYHGASVEAIRAIAEQERAGIVRAAELLRGAGLPCPVVSAGSTPTACHAVSLDGVTEMRPGVYMFGDVDQALLGSCGYGDIAVTVLASVIGHNRRTRRIVTDAGGLALSKDIGPAEFDADAGYGRVMGPDGAPRADRMHVAAVSQEHGQLGLPGGAEPPWEDFPVGSRLRIFPNHACMTAAAHDRYHLLGERGRAVAEWGRVNGW